MYNEFISLLFTKSYYSVSGSPESPDDPPFSIVSLNWHGNCVGEGVELTLRESLGSDLLNNFRG